VTYTSTGDNHDLVFMSLHRVDVGDGDGQGSHPQQLLYEATLTSVERQDANLRGMINEEKSADHRHDGVSFWFVERRSRAKRCRHLALDVDEGKRHGPSPSSGGDRGGGHERVIECVRDRVPDDGVHAVLFA
jgi:hypothetical protein